MISGAKIQYTQDKTRQASAVFSCGAGTFISKKVAILYCYRCKKAKIGLPFSKKLWYNNSNYGLTETNARYVKRKIFRWRRKIYE